MLRRRLLTLLSVLVLLQAVMAEEDRLLQTYQYNSVRMSGVATSCGSLNKTNLVSSQAMADTATYNAAMAKAGFNINMQVVLQGLTASPMDTSTAITQAKTLITPFGLFAGPFILGLIVMVVTCPYIFCCCTCPSCCPSKCCQKAEEEQYTKCELVWPVLVLTLLLGLGIVSAIVGFTRAGGLATGLSSTMCSVMVMIDDFINGNAVNGNYFIGLNPLGVQINNLNSNLTNINNNLTTVNTAHLSTVTGHFNTALSDISLIPSGTAGGSMAAFGYNSPLDGTPGGGTAGGVQSLFPSILGNSGSSNTIIGGYYAALNSVSGNLSQVGTLADNFASQMSSFTSVIPTITNMINNMTTLFNGVSTSVSNVGASTQPIFANLSMAVTAFFAAMIALGVITLSSLYLMALCSCFKMRYLMYFVCLIFFLIGILCFLLSTVFSVLLPFLYMTCTFLTDSLSSQASFQANLGFLVSGSSSDYITVCLPSGTGDLMSVVGGSNTALLNTLSTAVSQLNVINGTALAASLLSSWATVTTAITDYKLGMSNDIADTSLLTTLSNPSNYPGCTTGNFQSDSWIPSSTQFPSYVSCTRGSTYATSATCTSTANFNSAAAGCMGCMDTNSLFSGNATAVAAKAGLTARYSGGNADCTNFNTQLSNVWQNLYVARATSIGSLNARVATATTAINTAANDLSTTIATAFSSIITTFTATVNSITDPTAGLLAGLNCKLLGNDITTIVNTLCSNFFNAIYVLRLTLGIIAFSILFGNCCIVCNGVRYYKHSERKDKVNPATQEFGGQDQSTSQMYAAKY